MSELFNKQRLRRLNRDIGYADKMIKLRDSLLNWFSRKESALGYLQFMGQFNIFDMLTDT